VRAIVVELAARLETMRHLEWLPRYQQQLVALETLQIYAPMAHAIGTGSIMWELEDAAFRVLYPSAYASVEAWLLQHWQHSEGILEAACADLNAALRSDPLMQHYAHDWALSSRTKSLYSFMRKQLR
jgi:GTP pyrophosphokinase